MVGFGAFRVCSPSGTVSQANADAAIRRRRYPRDGGAVAALADEKPNVQVLENVQSAGKAMRDKDSCEMLDIIRASRTIDPELAYNFLGVTSIYYAALNSGSADALASSVQRSQKAAEKLIERFVKQYQ